MIANSNPSIFGHAQSSTAQFRASFPNSWIIILLLPVNSVTLSPSSPMLISYSSCLHKLEMFSQLSGQTVTVYQNEPQTLHVRYFTFYFNRVHRPIISTIPYSLMSTN